MFAALLAAALSFTPADAQLAYDTAAELVRDYSPRHAGTLRGRLAAGWLLDRVSRTGVDAAIDSFTAPTPDGEKSFANVIVEFPGTRTNAPWVVVMSHYDTAPLAGPGFKGANDGASTSGLLVALAGAIRRAGPLGDNLALVWTDAEECRRDYGPRDGFQGSKHLVEFYRAKRRAVQAAICLDMLGDRDLNIIVPGNGDPTLRRLAQLAAARTHEEGHLRLADDLLVKDDHQAFLEAKCPAIDLIDFDFGSAPGRNDYWHTQEDTIDKISVESLLASGKIAAELISLLMQ